MTAPAFYPVYADLRWPRMTGIAKVQAACCAAAPPHVRLVDLHLSGSLGSPGAPLTLTRALQRMRDGVFWNPGFLPPLWARIPSVVTVHDLTHRLFYSRLHRAYYDIVLKPLYRRCAAIICVSEFTRATFLSWSKMAPHKVHVVLNGVCPDYAANTETLDLPYPYVLYPGNHRPYKNLARLLEAYARSRLPQHDIHLVLTGELHAGLQSQAAELGIADRVHFCGWLDVPDLPKLYRGALAVAYISLYEGFGLPIVEAMASGVPVMTSNVSSMPEIAGDAALLVDPYSIEEITKGLNTLALDEAARHQLIACGAERVLQFDWKKSAAQLWNIVDSVADGGARS
ncbi:MAG TPA: glycosyltransferase family 1 protein [Sulfuriferula sp.]|nr:glycosyltransferase family 1 protein [Sulfuriferula sp.]